MSKEVEDEIRFLEMCANALDSVTFSKDLLQVEWPSRYMWICESCAMAMGGSDKRTLGATGHRGKCDKCDTDQDLFTVWDWSLGSDGKPREPKKHEVD